MAEGDSRPPWEALPADALRHCLSFLPDPASRAAARATCTRWRQTADDSAEVWGAVAAKRSPAVTPTRGPDVPSRQAPTPQQLAALLARQCLHLRRLTLELGCAAEAGQARPLPRGELPPPPQLEAEAAGLARVLAAACGEGSGLTDLTLAIPAWLPDCVMEALPGAAAQLTSLSLKPLLGRGAALRWSQLGEGLQGLHSLALACDFGSPGPPAALSSLTALTRLRLDAMPAQRGWQQSQEVGPALAAAHPGLLQLELKGRLKVTVLEEEPEEEGVGPFALLGAGLGVHGGGGLFGLQDENDDDDGPPLMLAGEGAGLGLGGGDAGGLGLGGAADGGPPGLQWSSDDDDDAPPPLGAAVDHILPAEGPAGAAQLMGAVPPPLMAASSDSDDADGPPSLGGSAGSEASDDDGPPGLHIDAELSESEDSEDEGPPGLVELVLLGVPLDEVQWPPQSALARQLWDRWKRLETLKLSGCTFQGLQILPQLPCLTSLHLGIEGCTMTAAMWAQQCSHLQELVLGRYLDASLPQVPSGALQQLTRLRIAGSRWLRQIHPSWCALPALLSFEVESCERLRRLPDELTALTGLQRIRFSHQRLEQLPTQITGLSQLTRLAVTACSLRELPGGPYLRALQELSLFANQLDRVPPALAGATRLSQLDLSSNYSHQLSSADVAVLAQLPALASLDLSTQYGAGGAGGGGGHPAEALAQLRAALPHCEVRA